MARTRTAGMSGLAVAMAAVGAYAVYAGINGIPFAEGLRDIVSGKLPAPRAPKVTQVSWQAAGGAVAGGAGGAGGATGSRIADAARKYLGIPYVWAAHDPASGFDCSGLVTYVLVHDIGLTNLPSNTHTVTGQFLVWSGAQTIPRANCAAGDLIVWPGHMGIATSPTTMIHAPTSGDVVKESKIWWTPEPLVRRVFGSTPGVPASRGPF